MIIVRSPLRISFFGGGTDHPAWFERELGAVLSTTIDKYVYVQMRGLPAVFDFNYRVAWGILEEVKSVSDIQHPVVREVLRHYGANDTGGYEVIYNADLPSRTGLGSSSAFTVSFLHAYFGNQGRMSTKTFLAREAIHVEQNILKETVGCQDQIAAAYGGLNRIDFHAGGNFQVHSVTVSITRQRELESSLLMFFTGFARTASDIETRKLANFAQCTQRLRLIYQMVGEGEQILASATRPLSDFGRLLHEAWMEKRSLDSAVSNAAIDDIYDKARDAGALGGKLLGAGGGGFLLMFVPPEHLAAVRAALNGLPCVPFRMERSGTSCVLYNPELDMNYTTAQARMV